MKVKITDIKLNPSNPRTITDDKFQKLVKSIKEFPEMLKIRPIVVNDEMVVLGGNMRLKACEAAGMVEVAIIKASELTPEQQREFIMKDNISFGSFDWELIGADWDTELLEGWGLDVEQWEPEPKDGLTDDDAIPEEVEPICKTGDLWQLGEHRLLCGDATVKSDVDRLLNNKEPYLMITDPPYGVNYTPTWRHDVGIINSSRKGKVQNDDRADWTDAWVLSPSKVAYVWHSGLHSSEVQESLKTALFEMRTQIIWNKQHMVFSRGDYHWKHEPCWYAVKKGNKGNWAGDRKQTTVWDITSILQSSKTKKEDAAVIHGTQKPVECMERPLRNHDGDVYDPFLGSGSTIIAAEKTNRKCYGMEIDEHYCDIIIKRWEDYTGKKAVKL